MGCWRDKAKVIFWNYKRRNSLSIFINAGLLKQLQYIESFGTYWSSYQRSVSVHEKYQSSGDFAAKYTWLLNLYFQMHWFAFLGKIG